MKASEIFTPGSFPQYTFIDDHLLKWKQILIDTLESDQVISISGPSKSGKTVFVQDAVGADNLIHITGAGISDPEALWLRAFDIIGTPIPSSSTKEVNVSAMIGGKTSVEAGVPLVAKGATEISGSGTWGGKASTVTKSSGDLLNLLIKELAGTSFVLFIDDFHYIEKSAQGEIARQVKEAIRQKVKIICASVPYHSDDVVRANADLRGRLVGIDFDYWDETTLGKIARKGFDLLNILYSEEFISKSTAEAAGSPQLMQSICLNSCFESGLRGKQETLVALSAEAEFREQVFSRTALSVDYSSTLTKMLDGPKVRGKDRKHYFLCDGSQCDVYPVVLKALALDPPRLTIGYSDLVKRVEKVIKVGSDVPTGSSVANACTHISAIANSSSSQQVIEWDSENDVIDIQDPYLLFYLRWNS